MKKRKGLNHFFANLWRYKALVFMAIPGMLWMIFFFYIPVLANVVAFKNFHISADGFLASLRESPWVGWDNFKFLFSSDQAFLITKNTIFANEKNSINIFNLVIGLIIIGVEGGYMLMYRTGWEVSKASVFANIVLAGLLLILGAVLFKESIDAKKIIGVVLCALGIALLK